MRKLFGISNSNYLQYIRSYAFLLTMAIAVYMAYAFVPASDASYRTLRIGNYAGVNNAAWTGYVTAMMTSNFLCLFGFFLVNSNIKRDMDTGVGMIIAATPISNFSYLLTKAWSNFLVLFTILFIALLMSITIFLVRAENYPFEFYQFILPFLLITTPAIFLIATLAVVTEVFFYRHSLLLNLGFFFLFMFLLSLLPTISPEADFYGIRVVTMAMQHDLFHGRAAGHDQISMGFLFSKKHSYHQFAFEGIRWSPLFLLSRFAWMCTGVFLILISSRYFHRFDISPGKGKKIKRELLSTEVNSSNEVKPLRDIKLSELPQIKPSYNISPLIQTELLLLFRKGPKWLWLVNIGGMIALMFSPLPIAHQFILPGLWFLQVARWSDLSTKEKTNGINYFSFASYKPLTRLFSAQLIAGVVLSLLLSSPLVFRYLLLMQFLPLAGILIGAVFIVLAAVVLGMLSGGKKLFEIIFFLCAYANFNKVPFTDYFGGINHSTLYLTGMLITTVCMIVLSFQWRKMEMKKL